MDHILFLRTFVLLDVLAVMAALPVQGRGDDPQHLRQPERQLLEQWRNSSKAFQDQRPPISFNDIITAKEFDERLAEDNRRAELALAPRTPSQLPPPSESVSRPLRHMTIISVTNHV